MHYKIAFPGMTTNARCFSRKSADFRLKSTDFGKRSAYIEQMHAAFREDQLISVKKQLVLAGKYLKINANKLLFVKIKFAMKKILTNNT